MIEASNRTTEGHQLAIHIVRLRPDGSVSDGKEEKTVGGSPSMPAEAPFGLVHLGEKFASHMLIRNEGIGSLHEIKVKIELQTSSQRSVLCEMDTVLLETGQTLTCQALHDIKEIGVHVLVCSVHFSNPVTNEKSFSRKFFKFTAINPLILKTKVTEMPEYLLMEAQVQNVSRTSFHLESVSLEPIEGIKCHTVEFLMNDNEDERDIVESLDKLSVCSRVEYCRDDQKLYPDSIYQYVFVIILQIGSFTREVPLDIGRLDIKWTSEEGESGRLQTGILSHNWDYKEAIRPVVKNIPKHIKLHEPFKVILHLRNETKRTLENVRVVWECPEGESLQVDGIPVLPFVPVGPTEFQIGSLTEMNSTHANLSLTPLMVGIQQSKYFYIVYEDGDILVRIPLDFAILVGR